ncbi:PE-PPE domain-containing protein [Candidatus Saccharibacteria bacterium]|nr:PE-PPE domain-containing protein [Candidatus Saccharibacteria bacterium]
MLAKDYISGLASEGATLVVVPGTDDTGARNLGRWLVWFFALFSRVVVIDYPGTVGPLIGGLRSDRYDQSRDKAVVATVELVGSMAGKVVIIGYSQGAEAAWLATARLHSLGVKSGEIELIVWAHPQHPTGLKAGLKRHHPLVSLILSRLLGAQANGAADEQLTGDIPVTSLAITGDPVTALEVWWKNPLGFSFGSITGFLMIHAGLGRQGAARLDTLSVWGSWRAPGSNTTHVVVDSVHPMTQFLRRQGFVPSVRMQKILAMIAPISLPGQRSASVFAVRHNWRVARMLDLAPVTPLQQSHEKSWTPEVKLASAG